MCCRVGIHPGHAAPLARPCLEAIERGLSGLRLRRLDAEELERIGAFARRFPPGGK